MSPCIVQPCPEQFPLCHRWRHPPNEHPYLIGQGVIPNGPQFRCRLPPAFSNVGSRFSQSVTADVRGTGLAANLADRLKLPCLHVSRLPALGGAENSVRLACSTASTYCSLSRIRRDAQFAKILGELLPPIAEGRFPNVEPLTLLSDGLEDYVDMGMSIIRVQCDCVAMLQLPFVLSKC